MSTPKIECERYELELCDGVTMAFRKIPACPNGFLMGSREEEFAVEEPIHRVIITEDFWLGETPVTKTQFDLWPGAPARGESHYPEGKPNHPANYLSWGDTSAYCEWLTRGFAADFPPGFKLATLPMESQWEYACRGDSTGLKARTEYHTGDGETALDIAGWYDSNSGNQTRVVKNKSPNAIGLYDMHGNVWEWCLDRWDANAYRRRWDGITECETFELAEMYGDQGHDPIRVLRGGACWVGATGCRTAYRYGFGAGIRGWRSGFRVCLVRSPTCSQSSGPEGSASPTRTDSERR